MTNINRYIIADALKLVPALKAEAASALADWKAEAEEAHRDGFRPHYCLHGTNLWTDYDNICWQCEEYGFNGQDPLDPYRIALARTKERYRRATEVMLAVMTLQNEGVITPEEVATIANRLK